MFPQKATFLYLPRLPVCIVISFLVCFLFRTEKWAGVGLIPFLIPGIWHRARHVFLSIFQPFTPFDLSPLEYPGIS